MANNSDEKCNDNNWNKNPRANVRIQQKLRHNQKFIVLKRYQMTADI